jgi:hypothetical protein
MQRGFLILLLWQILEVVNIGSFQYIDPLKKGAFI